MAIRMERNTVDVPAGPAAASWIEKGLCAPRTASSALRERSKNWRAITKERKLNSVLLNKSLNRICFLFSAHPISPAQNPLNLPFFEEILHVSQIQHQPKNMESYVRNARKRPHVYTRKDEPRGNHARVFQFSVSPKPPLVRPPEKALQVDIHYIPGHLQPG
jgi:hypothetical protein